MRRARTSARLTRRGRLRAAGGDRGESRLGLVAVVLAVVLATAGVVAFMATRAGEDVSGDGPRTALQFRPVLGQAGGCEAGATANPPADQPASLLHQGRCTGFGPSVLTVRKAGVSQPIPGPGGQLRVQVNLTQPDARVFAQVTEDYVGKQVAAVAFGRVLLAPVVQEPITNGEIEIVGLSSEEAASLRSALR